MYVWLVWRVMPLASDDEFCTGGSTQLDPHSQGQFGEGLPVNITMTLALAERCHKPW